VKNIEQGGLKRVEPYVVRLYNDDEMDLMDVTAIDCYKYALKLLSFLFSNDEIKNGAVEPTLACKSKALDTVRVTHIKSEFGFLI
jgi:hypothetical protein